MTARLGTVLTIAERVELLEHRLAEALARISVLEDVPKSGDVSAEDGSPRPPGRWLKMKPAVKVTGYSRSGLLKLCREGRARFDFDGPHRLIDVTSIVPRVHKVSKVSA
jgi:hypothetical protein